ncbi:MAG: hypothetical protein RR394_09925, partial [Oscillospiraceae bacterium]
KMDRFELDGTVYTRYAKKWSDPNGLMVSEILQDKLNKMLSETIDFSKMQVSEIIAAGDKFKESGSIGLAVKCYDYAIPLACKNDAAYILPRLTSCYRKRGMPQRVIDAMTDANKKYGAEIISAALLTSAAAAYCDLDDYEKAAKCCDRAFAKLDGKASVELSMVYKRIRANVKE